MTISSDNAYNERSLIEQMAEGDEQAFAGLFNYHMDAVYYFCKKYMTLDADAEDVTSAVFQKLWTQRSIIDSDKPLRPYLVVLARNMCFNILKMDKRRSEREAEALRLANSVEDPAFNEHEMLAELMQEIDLALQQMPAQMAHIFRLAYLEGHSNGEIAELLAISERTVRNQKSLALKSLRLKFTSWLLFFAYFM